MSQAKTSHTFLSYSRLDQAFAAQLARDLRSNGIDLWFDQLDIAPGQNWDEAIHEALNNASAILFLVSAHSVKSENVLNEITVALDAKKSVIPLMLADVPVPLRIARMQRVNFAADYTTALNQLIAHLRGYGSRTTQLEAISVPPAPGAATAQGPQRSSLAPVQRASDFPSAKRPWLVPALAGLGAGVVGLFVLLIIIGSNPRTPPSEASEANSVEPAGPAPATAANAAASTLPESLQGKWQSACDSLDHGWWRQRTRTLRSTTLTSDLGFFQDEACSEALYNLSTTCDVESVTPLGSELFAVNFRIQELATVPKDIDRSQIQAEDLVGDKYAPGMPIFGLLGLKGEELHEANMALSAEERPLELDDQGYRHVEP